MATERQRTGNPLPTRTEQPPNSNKFPSRRVPIQRSIQKLSDDLDALNEWISFTAKIAQWLAYECSRKL
jgi:hypothetical protein